VRRDLIRGGVNTPPAPAPAIATREGVVVAEQRRVELHETPAVEGAAMPDEVAEDTRISSTPDGDGPDRPRGEAVGAVKGVRPTHTPVGGVRQGVAFSSAISASSKRAAAIART
jgi:hypothetical protein